MWRVAVGRCRRLRYSAMVPPPAKKRRLAASAAAAAGVATTRRTTTRSQKPRLSAELLARVASYSSLGRDLLNLCVVAGPKDCALIRYAYLRNNIGYLKESFARFIEATENTIGGDRVCVRDRYKAWMAVNTDWRKHVTDENIEKSKKMVTGEEGKGGTVNRELTPFNNSVIAVELGLMEPLKYLVEEMGIDVNSYQLSSRPNTDNLFHILTACIWSNDCATLKYLLARGGNMHAKALSDSNKLTIIKLAFVMPHRTNIFRSLLEHDGFDLVTSFTNPPLHWTILNWRVGCFQTWKTNFRLLLSAGADPYVEFGGLDAIQFAKQLLPQNPENEALKDVIEILEDWVATK